MEPSHAVHGTGMGVMGKHGLMVMERSRLTDTLVWQGRTHPTGSTCQFSTLSSDYVRASLGTSLAQHLALQAPQKPGGGDKLELNNKFYFISVRSWLN